MSIFFQIFWSFFKIGSFTIGGGYAMIPLMEKELVERRRWLPRDAFLDLLSLAQAMPGIFAVNMATSIGYQLRGKRGALIAVVGNIFMPILIILMLAMFFRYARAFAVVEHAFQAIRPAVVALILVPVFNMAKTAQLSWRNIWLPTLATLLIWQCKISPAWIIIVVVVCSALCLQLKSRKGGAA